VVCPPETCVTENLIWRVQEHSEFDDRHSSQCNEVATSAIANSIAYNYCSCLSMCSISNVLFFPCAEVQILVYAKSPENTPCFTE
jgi:hypothetical protein